jgi:N-methylhydantoinase A
VTLRLRARGGRVPIPPEPAPRRRAAARGRRPVVFDGVALRAAVVRRDDLGWGDRLAGPAVVCEYSATTLVPPRWRLAVDRVGGLVLDAR